MIARVKDLIVWTARRLVQVEAHCGVVHIGVLPQDSPFWSCRTRHLSRSSGCSSDLKLCAHLLDTAELETSGEGSPEGGELLRCAALHYLT